MLWLILLSYAYTIESVNDESSITHFLRTSDTVLLRFSANWCDVCETSAGAFREAASAFNSSSLSVAFGECVLPKGRALANSFGITHLPTYLLFRHGSAVHSFAPEPTRDALVAYMTYWASAIVHLVPKRDSFLKENSQAIPGLACTVNCPRALLVLGSSASNHVAIFQQIAEELHHLGTFGVLVQSQQKETWIEIYYSDKETTLRTEFRERTEWETKARDFLEHAMIPLCPELSAASFDLLYDTASGLSPRERFSAQHPSSTRQRHALLLFLHMEFVEDPRLLVKLLGLRPKLFAAHITDAKGFEHVQRLLHHREDVAELCAVSESAGRRFVLKNDSCSLDDMLDFATAVAEDRAEQWRIYSDDSPLHRDASTGVSEVSMRVLTDRLRSSPLSEERWVVLFTLPSCIYSPISLLEHLASLHSDIRFVSVNLETQFVDCRIFDVDSVPTLFVLRKDGRISRYDGPLEQEALEGFIQK